MTYYNLRPQFLASHVFGMDGLTKQVCLKTLAYRFNHNIRFVIVITLASEQ